MTTWSDDEANPAITKVEANPHTIKGGIYEQHEAGLFKRFWHWLFPRLERGADMAEAFGDAEVAQRDASARRTAEEAAEIAAKREISEAKAGLQRQLDVKQFIENIDAIESLDSIAGQTLAFAKLLEQNPGIMDQVELIESMVARLGYERGLMISRARESATERISESQDELET